VRAAMAEELKAEMAKENEATRVTMREEIAKDLEGTLKTEMATATEAAKAGLRTEIAKDVESTLKADLTREMTASIKSSVDSTVKGAVSKELSPTKLRTAVTGLAEIKALKADVRTLNTSVRKLEGGQG
jgi:polyribonucleotide nucleotidyltransferase